MIRDFSKIDSLSPKDFECFVKELFDSSGWKNSYVTQIGKDFRHGDGGVDIFAYKNEKKYAIEVKQRKKGIAVDVKALNQLVTGASLAKAKYRILVTNSVFTSEVILRAQRLGVELIDREGLKTLFEKNESEIGRSVTLRPYQKEIIEQCLKNFESGKNKVLIEMATGLGKTYTAASLIKKLFLKSDRVLRVLFLSHQIEILLQSITSFKNIFGIGTYSFSACFAGNYPEETDFVFATFDTMLTHCETLRKNTFDLIVIDEAHHVPAATYSFVTNYLTPTYLIGLTATPYRQDDKNVTDFFGGTDCHIGKYDLLWALKHKKLAFPKYLVLLDDLDNNRLDLLEKGFSINDLDKKLFLHKKDEEVIKIIQDTIVKCQIENPKAIVFCKNIMHIKYLIQFFEPGTATTAHSDMSSDQRRDNIMSFREGQKRFILVCNLFNEGIDVPETNILVFLKCTKSRNVWLQQLGRGLRKTSKKDYVHVLDFVGSLERLNEIDTLFNEIKNIPLDQDNLDDSDQYHDSSMEVIYSKSAAQVTKLIKELKYKLATRVRAVECLKLFYEKNNHLPDYSDLEIHFGEINNEQINIHFGSYMSFVELTFQDNRIFDYCINRCKKCIGDYFNSMNTYPSSKAISLESEENNLALYTENEVNKLLEYIDFEEFEFQRNEESIEHCKKNSHVGNKEQENTFYKQKVEILEYYQNKILNAEDLVSIPEKEMSVVLEIFQSKFYFLNQLRLFKEKNHVNE